MFHLIKIKDKWLNAINQDQLTWPNHVSELTGWKSTPGKKYGVTSIPKTFLIDKNGIIIDYDLRGEALEKNYLEILYYEIYIYYYYHMF